MKLQKTLQSMSVDEGPASNGEETQKALDSSSTQPKGGTSILSGKKKNHKGPKR